MNRVTEAERTPERPRIFGLGLGKTGTSSFHRALTILGFKSIHNGGPPVQDAVARAFEEKAPLLSHVDPDLDAFSDIRLLSQHFALLDRQYPGSYFVLTLRPLSEWLDSRRRHVERNVALREAGQYTGKFLVVEERKWTRAWEQHTSRVRKHFAGRPDFVEMDITTNPSWGPLCDLLELPAPAMPFPWANRSAAADADQPGEQPRADAVLTPPTDAEG